MRASGGYTIDAAHSWVGFAVKHAGISLVRGSFATFEGSGHLDGLQVGNTRLELTIESTSVTTNNPDRDAHLRSPTVLTFEVSAVKQV